MVNPATRNSSKASPSACGSFGQRKGLSRRLITEALPPSTMAKLVELQPYVVFRFMRPSPLIASRQDAGQILAGVTLGALRDRLRRSGRHKASAASASFRPEIE